MAAHFGWGSDAFPCPEYYHLVASARFYGVPPWVMMEQSVYWQEIAGIVSAAEASASKQIAAHEK